MCKRPFDENIWSSFIYSFFSAWPFDQKLGSSLMYFFYLHTTIRQKYMIFFVPFIFSLRTTLRTKIRILISLLLLFAHNQSTKLGSLLLFNWFFSSFCQYFVSSTAFILCPVYPYPYISYTMFMAVLLLHISYVIFIAIWSLSQSNDNCIGAIT